MIVLFQNTKGEFTYIGYDILECPRGGICFRDGNLYTITKRRRDRLWILKYWFGKGRVDWDTGRVLEFWGPCRSFGRVTSLDDKFYFYSALPILGFNCRVGSYYWSDFDIGRFGCDRIRQLERENEI